MIKQSGQALITLLVFTALLLMIGMAAIMVMITNSQSTTKLQQSTLALYIAESGVENALLRLLRDPNYSGEVLPVETGQSTITVTDIGGNQKKIVSKGKNGDFLRTMQITIDYTGNIMSIISWKEI